MMHTRLTCWNLLLNVNLVLSIWAILFFYISGYLASYKYFKLSWWLICVLFHGGHTFVVTIWLDSNILTDTSDLKKKNLNRI